MYFRYALLSVAATLALASCSNEKSSETKGPILLDTTGRYERSNLAANLMTTAIREETNVDIVFYPSTFLEAEKFAIIDSDLNDEIINDRILALYPNRPEQDQFQVGTLRGSEIREFILNRTLEHYRLDLHTAGLEYDIQFIGGLPTMYQVTLMHGRPLEDDTYYRVAVSDYGYSNYDFFPGYKYRNSFEQRFLPESELISARDSLVAFLKRQRSLPLLYDIRANVRSRTKGIHPTPLTIEQIQGSAHLSEYNGFQVLTKGILTQFSTSDMGTMDIFLQMPDGEGDSDPRTSRAINVTLEVPRDDLQIGQEIEVAGQVNEVMTFQGITRTAIRNVDSLRVISQVNPLPSYTKLGGSAGYTKIPNRYISTYRGNLNQKKELVLTDAFDFWESLEGMLVQIEKPTVVGFRGGQAKFDEPKNSYLTLYVRAEGVSDPANLNDKNGLLSDVKALQFNPDVVRMVFSDINERLAAAGTPNFTTRMIFEAGKPLNDDVQGILNYQTNTFGDGEYVLYPTSMIASNGSMRSLESRDQTRLVGDEDHLTVAVFNVENLPANRPARIKEVARAISISMKCPDIVVLPEIQDFNGESMVDGSAAEETIKALIESLTCADKAYYRGLNVDPVPIQDGGVPGGNIRVAMIFNSKRVGFKEKGKALALDDNTVEADGSLRFNPGRLFPNDEVFSRTRKPLSAEFTFKGQRVVVIGTHLNSKLGDGNLWGVTQPLGFDSEVKRSLMSKKINEFVARLVVKDPNVNVIVAGDMNAYWNEDSIKALAGSQMVNLMTFDGKYPKNKWYSSNYNGSTGAIDHILATHNLAAKEAEFEILHINSMFMFNISDHDPVIARFKF